MDPVTGEIGLHATPIVAKNTVIVGAAHMPGGVAQEQAEREGLHPRLRRQDRQAPVDLPHDSAARRVRQRHVGKGIVGLHRQRRRVGTDRGRRRAQHGVSAGRAADGRLLRRPSSGRGPVRRERRRRRSDDRQAQVALPAGAPRHLGHGHPLRADPDRHHGQRARHQGAGAADQAGVDLHVRSHHGTAGVADRRTCRSRRATSPASGIRRRSPSSPSRRRSIARASRSTTSSTSRPS